MRRRLAAIAALIAASSLLAACTPDRTQIEPSDPSVTGLLSEAPADDVAPEDAAVYAQEVVWDSCGRLQCATIQVPVDWSDPNGSTIDLELNRRPALDQDARIGSLLINPGGPGGSGKELTEGVVTSAGEDVVQRFDIVGFDPRGVADSTPLACGDADVIDEYYLTDRTLDTEAALEEARQITAEFAEGCRELSGPLIENVDTSSVARDMDVIRAVLGDDELYYLGYSYGTQLGAVYAELFPQNVGRMVLDGAVDFLLPGEEFAAGQASGFEGSLMNFIDWCLDQDTCPLSGSPEQARQQVYDIAIQARDVGFESLDGDPVNGNLMVYGMVITMYDEGSWVYLEAGLDEVLRQGTADIFFQLANFYLDKDTNGEEYNSNSQWAFTAISCVDNLETEPVTLEEANAFRETIEEASPTFGWWFADTLGCDGWPWTAKEPVTALEAADDAAPILVIGTTNDPATPYAWAESLTEQLASSTLLTYEGEGHTAYGRSNQCIIDAVDGYLVGGEMPVSGKRC
ncbi:alpha/beta hydrolase [Demequina sp. SYSU T00192]|uniref:Alpha/beta hydrolase n=1 Tax=Demequina litoralis TaxID=3051660 RepID=A0ABT8GB54_9MICO|nr:alpha/beta hydrolase [Demequina sp. SYSU T00192]MDN4476361.1 alpha/beta hydrolase [Demequina sp. SYSU T00192]